jgi:hypothetical protein
MVEGEKSHLKSCRRDRVKLKTCWHLDPIAILPKFLCGRFTARYFRHDNNRNPLPHVSHRGTNPHLQTSNTSMTSLFIL